MRLSEMGTTGLVNYAVSGSDRMRGARTGRAVKIIAERHRSFRACYAFRKAVNVEIDRRRERGLL